MEAHRVLDNLGGRRLVDRETRRRRLLSAIGRNEFLVTPDLAEQLVDLRDTVTRVINNVVAGIAPSCSDWCELTDELCVAQLLWCTSRTGSPGMVDDDVDGKAITGDPAERLMVLIITLGDDRNAGGIEPPAEPIRSSDDARGGEIK